MIDGAGLDAREATAALREASVERLQLGFQRLVAAVTAEGDGDRRDWQISLTPFVDCARRLGADPSAALWPTASTGPDEFRETFDVFVRRTDVTLAAFGWSIVETPEGPAYRFEWPSRAPSGDRPSR